MTLVINATDFKANCLALLDEVAESGRELTVTKHGRPLARVVPVDAGTALEGSVGFVVTDKELIAPLAEAWHADAPLSLETRDALERTFGTVREAEAAERAEGRGGRDDDCG